MLQDFIDFIGGGYEPIVTELGDGTFDVSTNWAYIGAIAFTLIAFYCVMRIIGKLLCGRDRG